MSYDPQDPYRDPYGAPQQPSHPTPQQYGSPPTSPPVRSSRWPWVALGAAVLVLAGGVWSLYDRGVILKDSGVEACEAMRDGDKLFSGSQPGAGQITEAQYRQLRGVFEDSRHDDIRDHGTKLMDLVWQMSKSGKEPGLEALAFLGPLTTHLTGLQSACADQGVIVDLQPAAGGSAAPAAAKCDDLFPASGPITAGKDVSECTAADGAVMMVSAMPCTDDRTMFQLTPQGKLDAVAWGFGGEELRKVKGDPTQDRAYTQGSTDCFS